MLPLSVSLSQDHHPERALAAAEEFVDVDAGRHCFDSRRFEQLSSARCGSVMQRDAELACKWLALFGLPP
jgi:hypothetical protein